MLLRLGARSCSSTRSSNSNNGLRNLIGKNTRLANLGRFNSSHHVIERRMNSGNSSGVSYRCASSASASSASASATKQSLLHTKRESHSHQSIRNTSREVNHLKTPLSLSLSMSLRNYNYAYAWAFAFAGGSVAMMVLGESQSQSQSPFTTSSSSRSRAGSHVDCAASSSSSTPTSTNQDGKQSISQEKGGSPLRLGVCQITVGDDKQANLKTAKQAVKDAAAKGAKIISLPEVFNSPYATASFPKYAEEIPQDAKDAEVSSNPTTTMLRDVAKECGVFLIGGSFPERDGDNIYNTSLVFNPQGEIVAKHRKMHMFDIDVPGGITFKESETLSPGDSLTTFDTPYGKVGLAICYDMRFPQLAALLRQQGCDLLVYPGAFNMTTGPVHWELLQKSRALDNQLFVATVSPARNPDSSYQAWGHSTVCSPWGEVVATTGHEQDVFTVDIDISQNERIRTSVPISKQARTDLYEDVKWKGGASLHKKKTSWLNT